MKNQSKFAQFRNELEALNKEEMKIVSGGYMGQGGGGGGLPTGLSIMGGGSAWGNGGAGNLTPGYVMQSAAWSNASSGSTATAHGYNWDNVDHEACHKEATKDAGLAFIASALTGFAGSYPMTGAAYVGSYAYTAWQQAKY
jgi:hypothetical protein